MNQEKRKECGLWIEQNSLAHFIVFVKIAPAWLIYLRTLSRAAGIVAWFISMESEGIEVICEQLGVKTEL